MPESYFLGNNFGIDSAIEYLYKIKTYNQFKSYPMKKFIVSAICSACFLMAGAQQYEPKWIGEVNVVSVQEADTVITPAEKANVRVKTSSSAGRLIVGIGNTRQKVVIKGGRSTVQLPPQEDVVLVVKCKDNDSDPSSFIQIVKFEEKKKERKTELANVNWVGNVTEGNMELVPYEADKYGKSSYILKMPAGDGEYGVRVLNPNDKDEKVTIFYCFGIHSGE